MTTSKPVERGSITNSQYHARNRTSKLKKMINEGIEVHEEKVEKIKRKRGRPSKPGHDQKKRFAFRVSDFLWDEIVTICNDKNMTWTEFIISALEREVGINIAIYLKDHKTKTNPILEKYEQYKKSLEKEK
tara:strand:+ start:85 stop:477 length:393 start_codon:yes stop_codon:yes gene_type:complete